MIITGMDHTALHSSHSTSVRTNASSEMGYFDGLVCQWWWLLSLFLRCGRSIESSLLTSAHYLSYRYADVIVLFRLISTSLVARPALKPCSTAFFSCSERSSDTTHCKSGTENEPRTARSFSKPYRSFSDFSFLFSDITLGFTYPVSVIVSLFFSFSLIVKNECK